MWPRNLGGLQARRTLSGLLKQGKDALRQQDPDEAILAAKQVPWSSQLLLSIPPSYSLSHCTMVLHRVHNCEVERRRLILTHAYEGHVVQALSISKELTDVRAERAVLRLLARGYRAVRPLRIACRCQPCRCTWKLTNTQVSKRTPGCYTGGIYMLQCSPTASVQFLTMPDVVRCCTHQALL